MKDYIADRRQYGTTGKRTGGGWLIMRWDGDRQIFIEGTHYHQTKAGARETLREEQQRAMVFSAAARTLGRKGGSIKSERKASASRANGRLGGRPRGVLTTRSRIEARWTSDPADLETRMPIPGPPEAVGSPKQVFTAVREYKRIIGSAFCRVEYRHRGRILTREEITDLETAVMLAEQEGRE